MIYLIVILFGIFQGVTEFLPISSSGHLVLLHNFFDLPITNTMAFDVALHLATVFSVIICFRKEIRQLIKSFILSFKGQKDEYSKTSWLIIMATIPAAIFGFLFDDLIESKIHDTSLVGILVVAFMLITVAILFLWVEKQKKGEGLFTSLKWNQALLIGFAQALALIPGTSRSGITIIAGLKSGLKREEALKFSFLLSIPIILGASVKKIPGLFSSGIDFSELTVVLVGFLSSFITGIFVIKYFLRFARNHSLNIFAYYRIALALALFVYLYINF
jgi:undecaprenyl-diphosphatase